MAKVEVILTNSVAGLGAESDQVKVAAGYARNFLFPQRLAVPLTSANKRRLEVLRQRRAERETHELNTMAELAKMLSKVTLAIAVKTGDDDKMFGSVTSGTIADELKHQFDVMLDKRKIHIEKPIRALGEHEAQLRLHSNVVTTLKLRVDSTTPHAKPPEVSAAEAKALAKADSQRTEIRKYDTRKSSAPPVEAKKSEGKKAEPKSEGKKERPERKSQPSKSEPATS